MTPDAERGIQGRSLVQLAGLALPTLSTGLLRVNQLLVLILAASLGQAGIERDFLVTALGVMTAASIFSDSGSVNYILAAERTALHRATYRTCIRTHIGLGALGVMVALAVLAIRAAVGTPGPDVWIAILAVGLSQLGDSLLRVVRAPLLLAGRDAQFALPELSLGAGKLGVLAATFFLESLLALIFLPALSIIGVVVTKMSVERRLDDGNAAGWPVAREVLRFGITGAASGFYSQLPMIVAAASLPLSSSAMLAVAYRVTQPLELVPASLSQQVMPRMHRMRALLGRLWFAFALYGLGASALVLLGSDLLRAAFRIQSWDGTVLLIVASALVMKSGSYLLAGALMVQGGIVQRLWVTLMAGGISVVLLTFAAVAKSPLGIAWVSPISEFALMVGLALMIRGRTNGSDTHSFR